MTDLHFSICACHLQLMCCAHRTWYRDTPPSQLTSNTTCDRTVQLQRCCLHASWCCPGVSWQYPILCQVLANAVHIRVDLVSIVKKKECV